MKAQSRFVCPKNFIQPYLLQCYLRLLLESLKFMRKLMLFMLYGNLIFISCRIAMRIYITVIKDQKYYFTVSRMAGLFTGNSAR